MTTAEPKQGWLSRTPTFVFLLVCVIAAPFGAAFGFFLIVLLAAISGIPTETTLVLVALGTSLLCAVGIVILLVRARRRSKPRAYSSSADAGVVQTPLLSGAGPSYFPPPLPSATKRQALGSPAKLALGLVLLVALALILLSGALEDPLRLELRNGDLIIVTNVGRKIVDIQSISINERKECGPRVGIFGVGGDFKPTKLDVGDQQIWISMCRVVRVTVRTSEGSTTYSFD
jgi:hypothetical protein